MVTCLSDYLLFTPVSSHHHLAWEHHLWSDGSEPDASDDTREAALALSIPSCLLISSLQKTGFSLIR